jgi:hypothetical protein
MDLDERSLGSASPTPSCDESISSLHDSQKRLAFVDTASEEDVLEVAPRQERRRGRSPVRATAAEKGKKPRVAPEDEYVVGTAAVKRSRQSHSLSPEHKIATGSKAVIHARKPEVYTGADKTIRVESWLHFVMDYIQLASMSSSKWVLFAGTCLSGAAQRAWHAHRGTKPVGYVFAWTEFSSFMISNFGEVNATQNAEMAWLYFKFRPATISNDTITSQGRFLVELGNKRAVPPTTEDTITRFVAALENHSEPGVLLAKYIQQHALLKPFDTFDKLIAFAGKFAPGNRKFGGSKGDDHGHKEGQAAEKSRPPQGKGKGSGTPFQAKSSANEGKGYKGGNKGDDQPTKSVSFDADVGAKRKAKLAKLPPHLLVLREVFQERCANNACGYCGGKDANGRPLHLFKECPDKAAQKAQGALDWHWKGRDGSAAAGSKPGR